MQRLRLSIALVALIATITLSLSWNLVLVEAEVGRECNCIDGFTKLSGIRQWDPEQERFRCLATECFIITE